MSNPAIRVEALSKQYTVGAAQQAYSTFREAIIEAAAAPLRRIKNMRRKTAGADTIWALKDVSFEVEPGEVIGIVGSNGAGKSTLLKILSRITEPTTGSAEIRGRVASLLEVGTGFHAELTGRENIYLNGAILGMTRREIRQKFDEIVAFAEVERFIDTAVKRYSSGMYLRLAFAVAAHLQPEILLVDEVLAVGDAAFQKKCLGKMSDVARQGRTVLFVSHNLSAVRSLCPRSMYIDQGRIQAAGSTAEILELYSRAGLESTNLCWTRPEAVEGAMPQPPIRVTSMRLVYDEDATVAVDRPLKVRLDFVVEGKPSYVIPGVHFFNSEGIILFSSADWSVGELEPGHYTSMCEVPPFLLNDGLVAVMGFLYNSKRPGYNQLVIDCTPQALRFIVDASAWIEKTEHRWLRSWPGLVRPDFTWTTGQTARDEGRIRP